MQDTFLFLRAKANMSDDDAGWGSLEEIFPYQVLDRKYPSRYPPIDPPQLRAMTFGTRNKERIWSDGIVLRFDSYWPLDDLAKAFKEVATHFEALTIYRAEGFREFPRGGPLTQFSSFAEGRMGNLLFVMGHEKGVGLKPAIVELKHVLRNAPSKKIFEFQDGAVILSASQDAVRIMFQRCRIALDAFDHWAILDPMGDCICDAESTDIWMDDYFDELLANDDNSAKQV